MNKENEKKQKFVHLAPVDNVENIEHYAEALDFALQSCDICNIALTGPYGSGKSSIIKSYKKLRIETYSLLNISLANFKDLSNLDQNYEVSNNDHQLNQLIERSILQQMLYGMDADKLPFSRFRRIRKPKKVVRKSMLVTSWLFLGFFLKKYIDKLGDIDRWSCPKWLFISGIVFFGILSICIIRMLYIQFYKTPLKKISLPKAEVETADLPELSVLNKHLDEIIYFFQESDYDAVVFEDLDRFGSSDIFTKLREINKLINDNIKGCKKKKRFPWSNPIKTIKFIYAIRDDMFVHKDRTKFFDFIIPVVPVVNNFNSLDIIQSRLKDLAIAENVKEGFLKKVFFYLDDLRLIHNILNEFVLYREKIENKNLDQTKLLAMMIYKNVYPDDFEKLHNGKGALAECALQKKILVKEKRERLSIQIEVIQNSIQESNSELSNSMEELINIYIGFIVKHNDNPVIGFVINNQHIPFSQIRTYNQFAPLLDCNKIQLATNSSNHPNYRITLNKPFSQFEKEINPNKSFLERKKDIEYKNQEQLVSLQQLIHDLEKASQDIALQPLKDFLQDDEKTISDILLKNNMDKENGRLFSFLIKNGYLDENYQAYITNFYEGRLSSYDREYLTQIWSFIEPEHNSRIDNPNAICLELDQTYFGSKYILNVTMMDYLLSNDFYETQQNSALKYISNNFEQSQSFFNTYWTNGKHQNLLTKKLAAIWPYYSAAAIDSVNAPDHIALILSHVDTGTIITQNKLNVITDYLSTNGYLIFADLYYKNNIEILKKLNIKFTDLSLLEKFNDQLDYAHSENLYTITATNIVFLINRYIRPSNKGQANTANYSTISLPGGERIKQYIETNIMLYLDQVFFTLPDNRKESPESIRSLLNNEAIPIEKRIDIISSQDYIFENFAEIPTSFWTTLVDQLKIQPSWNNISEYFALEKANKEMLVEKIQSEKWLADLAISSISQIEADDEHKKALSKFIFTNDSFNNDAYSMLVKNLPYYYHYFPDVSIEKKIILAQVRRVHLTEESFLTSEDSDELRAILLENNYDDYFEAKDEYPIDDNIRELLLQGSITNEQKINICHDITPDGISASNELAKIISEFLAPDGVDCSSIAYYIMAKIIKNAPTTDIALRILVKRIPSWEETECMNIIKDLPEPYNEVATYGTRPKIPKNNVGIEFATLLESKGFISSIAINDDSIRINTKKSADH